MRNLESKPIIKIENLGKLIGNYIKMLEDHHEENYMNSLMDGSGECSHFWLDSQEREEVAHLAMMEKTTGYSFNQIIQETKERTCWKWCYKNVGLEKII